MHTTAKRFLAMCSMVVMLVLVASITTVPVFAASNGIYIARAHPQYRNPSTGVIEDSGGESSEVLGQSMTESATYKKALVEVDANGNTYATIRLQLADNIANPQFQVDGASVSATCMQENYGANTVDYRMRINSESSIIRCSITVNAMGRDVVFFITLSDLISGSEDFITSVSVVSPAPETPSQSPSEPEKPENPSATEANAPAVQSPQEEKHEDSKKVEETKKPQKNDNKKPGIQEFDNQGNVVDKSEKAADKGSHMHTFITVAIVVVAVTAIGGCVWYFGFFRKKK